MSLLPRSKRERRNEKILLLFYEVIAKNPENFAGNHGFFTHPERLYGGVASRPAGRVGSRAGCILLLSQFRDSPVG
jgi:hypothetical protein